MIIIYKEEEMRAMTFHETGQLARASNIEVLKVPGGWVYTISQHGAISTVFVPFTP